MGAKVSGSVLRGAGARVLHGERGRGGAAEGVRSAEEGAGGAGPALPHSLLPGDTAHQPHDSD